MERFYTRPEGHTAAPATLLPLVVHDLCYEIGGKRLLDGISFRTDVGPRTVVLGPNGAGKSLLLRLCHGLLQPSAGTLTWAAAAPEIITANPTLFNGNTCVQDTITRLIGVPASMAHVELCNLTISRATTVDIGKRLAVAVMMAAAYTCQ